MSLSIAQLSVLEEVVNRLATETIMAQPGSHDGLVPCYSLLSELDGLCTGDAILHEPAKSALVVVEKLLDSASAFDEPTLTTLKKLLDWMPVAITAMKAGSPAPTFGATASPAPSHGVDVAPSAADILLDLNLENNAELLGEFHSEAVDHLQQIEAALLVLDQNPDNPDAINSIFRSFHTIKGNAGFLGLVPMQSLAHEVESLLDLARNHKLSLNGPIITEILKSRDALGALTQQVADAINGGKIPTEIIPVNHLIEAVKVLAGNPATPQAVAPVAPPTPAPTPTPAPAPAAKKPEAPQFDPSGDASLEALLASVDEAQKEAAGTPPPKAAVDTHLPERPKPQGAGQTVRVNTEKLDSLMDVVGELVIVQSQLLESARASGGAGSVLHRNVTQLSRITKDLQHTSMSLRMIPIKQTFQKMERLSRDLARDIGKKVTFSTSGEDTELDRTVVEEIGDPLVHMVRNAMDHGLEKSADRVASGKPETGSISLKAYHQGSNIVIELRDDGRGINPEKVFAKAVEKGLVDPGAKMAKEDIYALIFAPGFSTAEKITSVSGRGVGMDVVKRNIEKLRGKIEIDSEVGKGSTFRIKLPLTMAIIDGLIVRVGKDRYILPSTSVQRAIRPAKEQISILRGHGEVLDLRGKFVPVHRLHKTLCAQEQEIEPWDGITVIIETAGKVCAFLVDEMISKQEVVIKSLGAYMQNLPGISGAAILGDGNIALIIDPGSIMKAN